MKKMIFTIVIASAALALASDPNLMSHWRLDESWGAKAYDSLNFYNLYAGGAISEQSWGEGKFTGSFIFDGETNFLGIGAGGGTVSNFGGMRNKTISIWLKFDDLDRVQYIFNSISGLYKSCMVMVNDQIRVQFYEQYGVPASAGDARVTPGFVVGQWHHLVYVVRDTTGNLCDMELYLDGDLILTKTGIERDISGYLASAAFGANAPQIGGDNFFAGEMDDIRIYSVALSQSAIEGLYAEQIAAIDVPDSDMITHLLFEETSGLLAKSSNGINHAILRRGFDPEQLPVVEGIYGNAMEFDGATRGALLSDTKSYGNFQNKTISMWFAPNQLPAGDTFLWSMRPGDGDGNFTFYILYRSSGKIRITFKEQVLESIGLTPSADPNAPNWYHLAVSVRNTEADGKSAFDFYLDGVLMGTRTGLARHIGNSWFGASIGAHAVDVTLGAPVNGLIDDFRIYDRILSGEEVAAVATKQPVLAEQTTFRPANDIELNWKFDQVAGLLIEDSSGADIYGKLEYSPDNDSQWSSGVYGNGIWLNGTSCIVLENYNNQYAFGAFSEKTMSMWVNPDMLGGTRFLFSMRPGGGSAYLTYILLSGNNVQFVAGLNDASARKTITSQTTLSPGNWYHITASIIPTSDTRCLSMLYINGVMEAIIEDVVRDVDYRWNGATFGGHAGDVPDVPHSNFAGTLDDLKIYGKTLSAEEVKAAYDYGQIIRGDITLDGSCGEQDLAAMAGQWLDSTVETAGFEYVIENGDFEDYADQEALEGYWQEFYWAGENGSTSSSDVALLTTPADAFSGSQAMRWDYNTVDTEGTRQFTDILYTFDTPIDLSGYDMFSVMFNKHAGNSSEDAMYVKFLKGGLTVNHIKAQWLFTEAQGSTAQPVGWNRWMVNLHRLQYPFGPGSIEELTDIQGLLFGCYTAAANGAGGTGTIDIDDISLIALPICQEGLAADIDGDCVVNLNDFSMLSADWLIDND